MKKNFYQLMVIAGLFFAGCAKTQGPFVNTPVLSSGSFSGQFKLYHVNANSKTVRIDSCNLSLTMELATGYQVTCDTTLHAASYGQYQVQTTASQVIFIDKTYPASGTPTKVHLSGTYNYQYDGSTLQLVAYGPMDTLQYFYNLTRTGN